MPVLVAIVFADDCPFWFLCFVLFSKQAIMKYITAQRTQYYEPAEAALNNVFFSILRKTTSPSHQLFFPTSFLSISILRMSKAAKLFVE